MNFIQGIKQGIQGYSDAITLVRQQKMYGLVLLSCLFYLIVIGIAAWLMWLGIDSMLESIYQWAWVKRFTEWTSSYPWILTITKIGIYLSSFFFFVSIYKYLFLALASPLYAYISERTAEVQLQKKFSFVLSQFIADVWRGILISIKNFFNQLALTILFFLLSFIPIVGWFFSIAIILTDCYYYGFSMLDYNCERDKMSIRDSRQLIRRHRGLAIGNGLIMYISFMVPIIGITLVAPLSAIAACISYTKIHNKS